jgi:hypothetical protein
MAALGVLGAMMGFAGGMAGLAGKAWENLETNRRFKLQSEQAEGATKAAQASSGIETIGGASPGAQIFQETQHREFQNQMNEMKRGQEIAMWGGIVGAIGGAAGSVAQNAFQMADLNKTGSTYTPRLTVPSTPQLVQSNFVKGALQSGPSWGP